MIAEQETLKAKLKAFANVFQRLECTPTKVNDAKQPMN